MKATILAFLALLLSQSALAQHRSHHHHHPRFGFYLGVPYPWYPSPAYYYPPSVVYAPAVTIREPVYIEQSEIVAPPPVQPRQTFEPGFWHYCQERSAYYPTVSSCPGPWQKVAPSAAQNG